MEETQAIYKLRKEEKSITAITKNNLLSPI